MFGGKKKIKENVPTSFSTSGNNTVTAKIPLSKEGQNKSNSTTLIAKDTQIVGNIQFAGNLEVEGKVVGNISCLDEKAESSLRLLESGSIEGDLAVSRASINGSIKGNVKAAHVDLAPKAKIQGNVHYQTLEMSKGAQVNGSLVFEQENELQASAIAENQKKQKEQQTNAENGKKE